MSPPLDDPRLHNVLEAGNAFGQSLAGFDHFSAGLHVPTWLRTDAVTDGRRALSKVVGTYAATVSVKAYYADSRLFTGRGSELTPALDASIWSISAALLGGDRKAHFDVDAALRLVFGADPGSQLFGSALGGRYRPSVLDDGVPPPTVGIPEKYRIPLDKLNKLACYGGLRDALVDVGRAAAAIGKTKPYPGMTITAIQPKLGCAGDVIVVTGHGFGATQPKDASVYFGSIRADVVAGSWTETTFSVIAPQGVGECCVSVLKIPPPVQGGDTLASAVSTLAGVITECFGKAGIAAGIRIGGLADRLPDSAEAVCARDGSNKFVGGKPRINKLGTSFGYTPVQRVVPGRALEVEWALENADSATLTITPDPANSPLAHPPSLPAWFVPDPVAGRTTLPTSPSLVPWKVTITLGAKNRCGSVSQSLELSWAPAPGFIFVGGGMRSSFDLGAIEALALVLPVGPDVCAGTGLGALSAVCAAADYANPASLRAFWDASKADAPWYADAAALQTPGRDYQALSTAAWQVRARAEVLSLDALGLLRSLFGPRVLPDRTVERLISSAAGATADKIGSELDAAISTSLEEAGQSALSYVPVFAIVMAVGRILFAAWDEAQKQQTHDLLAALPSFFDASGLHALLATATAGIDQRITTSGRRVRLPLTSLERGRALYGLEHGAVSEAPVHSQITANTTIGALVQAAASLPLLSPPQKIGADSLLDGSLRDPVPIGATIEAGAGTVIVIQPHIRLVAPAAPFATAPPAGMPRIDVRTGTLRDAQFLDGALNAFGMFARDQTTGAPVGSWRVPVFVIEPTVDIVGLGATVGQDALVTIMADYGYMRAYDAIVPWLLFPSDAQIADRDAMIAELTSTSDKIVGLRLKVWELEYELQGFRATPFGPSNNIGTELVKLPALDAIDPIRATKNEIRAAIVDRLAVPARYDARAMPVPPGTITAPPVPKPRAEMWVQGWEVHYTGQAVMPVTANPAMPEGDPWVSLGYAGETVTAGTRPAPLWP